MAIGEEIAVDVDRVVETFFQLVAVNAPSRHERPMAEDLVPRLQELGFQIRFDNAGEKLGGDCGNLIARLDGTDEDLPGLFFSTHMDTVLSTNGVRPVVRDGVVYSDGTTILGADDRAALTAYLEGLRVVRNNDLPHGPIELLLTVCEQPGLLGAGAMDYSLVTTRHGFVFDSSGDVGQIICRGPYSSRVHWEVIGRSAHLGLTPEEGINAIQIAGEAVAGMTLARVSETTVANVGVIHGGELASVVPDRVTMIGEARSYDAHDLEAQIERMQAEVSRAAGRRGGEVRSKVEPKYSGYSFSRDDLIIGIAERAAKRIGVQPYFTDTLGGGDTNVFLTHGLNVVTLGNGFRDIHSFREHISIENLVNATRYVIALVAEFGASAPGDGAIAMQ
ncbi:MAG: M20/M25/M40 family metallo-hydrolase [Chloroflexota bacterium]